MLTKSNDKITLPIVGQGGYGFKSIKQVEVIRKGIELGANFIDTAESYVGSEEIVGEAIKGMRHKVIIGTKFSPQNSSYDGVIKAAERSMRKMHIKQIDLYQLHWPHPEVPIEETAKALKYLLRKEKIKNVGVCNMTISGLKKVQKTIEEKIATLQMEYNLFDRNVEDGVMKYCKNNNILFIAYSPLDKGRIFNTAQQGKILIELAKRYNKTPSQIALNWLANRSTVVTIPRTNSLTHLLENIDSTSFSLTRDDANKIWYSRTKPVLVLPKNIRVSSCGEYRREAYQTIEEAKSNPLNFVPSPSALAKDVVKGKWFNPVRLVKHGKKYELVEGRVRYWAWVIAKGNVAIPSMIRENWE